MKTVLICHSEDRLTRHGFSRWLASFSELCAIVEIREPIGRSRQRVGAEMRRVGRFRFLLDVLPYRFYRRVFHSSKDRAWVTNKLHELTNAYSELSPEIEVVETESPNSAATREVFQRLAPDMALARCKTLIKPEIFSIPPDGTLIMHPGICPEYRNAHGCFWAMANGELEKVGMTLLKIDEGIDTGPIFAYYKYSFDSKTDTPAIINARVVYDNLNELQSKLVDIHAGRATPIRVEGRKSGTWGQPWLSTYLRLKRRKLVA